MPKCNQCQYLKNDSYEYPEYYCKIFGYEVPEKYIAFDGEGCKCTQKFLKKLSDACDKADEEYWANQTDDISEFFGALSDIKMLVKVIKEQTPIADEKYLKDYHTNLIQKKCELKIPKETLYAIINFCISWILEEYNDSTYPATPERWNKEQIDWYRLLDIKED